MTVTVEQYLMGEDRWSLEADWDPEIFDRLDPEGPWAKAHLLLYRGEALIAPPLVVHSRDGDRRGMVIGGSGLAWYPGSGTDGYVMRDREFISGASRLSNGGFEDLDGSGGGFELWKAPEESLWAPSGMARTGDLAAAVSDDPLADDVLVGESFELRPGQQHRLRAWARRQAGARGRVRLRTVYEGRLTPPELLGDNHFEGTGWTGGTYMGVVTDLALARNGARVLKANPIPKPQLVSDSGFDGTGGWGSATYLSIVGGELVAVPNPKPELVVNATFAGATGWTLDPTIQILNAPGEAFGGASWVMALAPNIKPQILLNPDFELGAGYPWGVPLTGDIGFVNDGSQAHSGTWVIKVGPIAQKQIVYNGDFEDGLNGWTQIDGIWYSDVGGGYEATDGATTQGITTGTPNKILQVDADWATSPGGATPMDVIPGEQYILEGQIRFAASTTNGRAYLGAHIPHPTVPAHQMWFTTPDVVGASGSDPGAADDIWRPVARTIDIPTNRFKIDVLAQTVGHTDGFIAFDRITLTRTRGNRDRMTSVPYPVLASTSYRLSAWLRSGANQQVGDVRFGVTLTGAGVDDEVRDTTVSHTDFEWVKASVDFSPGDGYDGATPFIVGNDIIGDPIWLDDMILEQTSNNTAEAAGTPFSVVADQRYLLSATVRSDAAATHGSVEVGVRLTGPGMAEQVVSASQGATRNKWQAASVDVRPGPGYTTATPFVRSTDIEGGTFYVGKLSLLKVDGNTDTIAHAPFSVVADQRYLLSATVRSDAAATGGSVTVGVTLSGPGVADMTFEAVSDLTKGDSKGISVEVRPPPGYTTAAPYVRSTDIEGADFHVDDVALVKMDNNSDSVTGPAFSVIPQRTYRWSAMVRTGPNLQRGMVTLVARYQAPGREDVVEESSSQGATENSGWVVTDFDVSAPSGYGTVVPSIKATDVEGDVILVDTMSVSDSDTTTAVFDAVSPETAADWTELETVSTAPTGAERIHIELVAEEGSGGWALDDTELARYGVPLSTHADVLRALLVDANGRPLPITAGNIVGDEVIPFDWHVLNLTYRDAWEHFCRVIASPLMEWRVENDASLTAGAPEAVFTDHVPGTDDEILFLERDLDVGELPSAASDAADRITDVVVIGATRKSATGQDTQIAATVSRTPTERDLNGYPLRRTRIVTDSTVDHVAHARALGSYVLDRANRPAVTVTAALTDTDTRPPLGLGEWVYVYKPDANLADPAYSALDWTGRTVNPRRLRVQGIKRELGPGHRAVIRFPDGSEVPLRGPRWGKDSTSFELGDPRPEFQSDPQGGGVATQFQRYLASSPR